MKPNFALSLSHDGISLLHRQDGGWLTVGAVPLDSPDLAVALADLRQAGRALAPGKMTTAIIVPADQVRFLALPGAAADDATVRAALDGATPYPVGELAYDFQAVDGTLHIAAVARETLAEAEGFAADHGFGPVGFLSAPQATGFPVGAFFGPSRLAPRLIPPGDQVERETPPAGGAMVADAGAEVPAAVAPAIAEPAPPAPEAESAVENGAENEAPALPEPAAATPAEGDAVADLRFAPPPPAEDPADAPVVFASRARPQRAAADLPPPAALTVAPFAAEGDDAGAEPVFAHRQPAQPAETPAPAPDPAPPAFVTPPPPPVVAEPVALTLAKPAPAPEAAAQPTAPAKADVPPLVAKRLAAPAWARIDTPGPAPRPAAQAAAPAPRPAAQATPRRRPRLVLGLALTGVLLLVLALIALWSTSLGTGLASLFGGSATEPAAAIAAAPETVAEPVPEPDPAPETAAAEPPAAVPGEVPETPLDTEAVAAAATAVATGFVTPEEADRIYDATGVWLRAPRLPLMPETEDLGDLATGSGDAAPDDAALAALPTGTGMAPDAGLPVQPAPPAAGASFPRDARGLIIASPEGTLLPNGATVFAAAPPLVPPTRPGTPPPAPDVAAAVAVETFGIRPAARPETVLAAAIAAGLAAAPDAAPADVAAEAPAITPGAVAYDGLRPSVRPGYMVPPAPWDGPVPAIRPEGLAPADAIPPETVPATEDTPPPADDLDATLLAIVAGAPDPLAGVTALAVPQARRPDARPRNFDSVVQTQLERLARAQQQQQEAAAAQTAAAAAPAPAPQTGGTGTGALSQEETAEAAPEISTGESLPAGAVPGSVAQNATLADAINLNEVNVIGVFGTQSNRRALVRLANGRILQVQVGDTLDGGQVTAIGDSFVNYNRRGQALTLHVPG